MYITGGIGSSGILERFTTDYDLPNDSNLFGKLRFYRDLPCSGREWLILPKDSAYMDTVERALYNTVLSGIAMDGKSFFLRQPAGGLASELYAEDIKRTR